jgi:hypothetical protein
MYSFGTEYGHTFWHKSQRSVNNGACLELTSDREGIAIRNSRDPYGPVLRFTVSEWQAFLDGAKKGEFDGIC